MNPSQANSRKCLQQSIDAEIKSLEESIRVLKSRRNALSPISSLHPELFAAIFSILCLPSTSPDDHHLARLHVSHVCHQWRETALNLPLLWSRVNFTFLSLAGAAEALARAKSVPLYLEANISSQRWGDDRFSSFQNELQVHIPHIRHLRICAEPVLLQGALQGLASPAPILEHLSLSSGLRRTRMGARGQLPIPITLFNSSTPRLSCLELHNCNINWRSPLLKGLKHLEIIKVSTSARPELEVWLAALDEMPQLTTLTLHSASPIAPPLPLVIERTITLPYLTRLDISGPPGDCALALAHLDLPALTSLCLTTFSSHLLVKSDVQKLLPFIVRHAHGPHDAHPLQSVLVRAPNAERRADILAWPVPNIDLEVHDLPTFLRATPTRVALSFWCNDWLCIEKAFEIFDIVMACLPLEGLVMLATHSLVSSWQVEQRRATQYLLHHLLPTWPLLQCVRLVPAVAHGFIAMLLEDNGGCEKPLLPSLTQLVMVDFPIYEPALSDALRKRVKQGVPLKVLDVRMCGPHYPDCRTEDWLQSLSQIVANILRPEETYKARQEIDSMWDAVARGPFVDNGNSSED